MAIITLTTDYGNKDYFTAAIKGAILSEAPEVQIIDISHQISPFNIMETAYVIENSYKHFPEKTIHIDKQKRTSLLTNDLSLSLLNW